MGRWFNSRYSNYFQPVKKYFRTAHLCFVIMNCKHGNTLVGTKILTNFRDFKRNDTINGSRDRKADYDVDKSQGF